MNIQASLAVALATGIAAAVNIAKSWQFRFAEFDSFQYLALARSLFGEGGIFLPPIRSALAALVFLPGLMGGRFVMALFHVGIAVLITLIAERLFRDRTIAAFSGLLYGLSWWMLVFQTSPLTDLPGMFLFLLGFFFWLSGSPRMFWWAGAVFGLAFLFRFDIVLLLLPLLWFTPPRLLGSLAVPFFGVAVLAGGAFDILLYPGLMYAPLEFLRYNLGVLGAREGYAFWDVSLRMASLFPLALALSLPALAFLRRRETRVLLAIIGCVWLGISLLHTPPYEARTFAAKLFPLLSIAAGYGILFLSSFFRMEQGRKIVGVAAVGAAGALGAWMLIFLSYPTRSFPVSFCPEGRPAMCSNFHSAVEYVCGEKTRMAKPLPGNVERDLASCSSFIYFKDISGYDRNVDEYLHRTRGAWKENETAAVFPLEEESED